MEEINVKGIHYHVVRRWAFQYMVKVENRKAPEGGQRRERGTEKVTEQANRILGVGSFLSRTLQDNHMSKTVYIMVPIQSFNHIK